MGFSDAKTVPCPPYMPPGTIESSKGLRPSRALLGFLTVWGLRRLLRAFFVLKRGRRRETAADLSGNGPRGAEKKPGEKLKRTMRTLDAAAGYAAKK